RFPGREKSLMGLAPPALDAHPPRTGGVPFATCLAEFAPPLHPRRRSAAFPFLVGVVIPASHIGGRTP
ncbi:MAG: hypothetical protein ACRDHP_19530, partial [Ktedonobacterales bacterium]